MSKTQDIRGKVIEYHEELGKEGHPFTAWKCGDCGKMNPHRCPTDDQVSHKGFWDSTMQCVGCNHLSFVTIFPTGKCIAKSFENDFAATVSTLKPRKYQELLKFLGKKCAYATEG